MKLEVYVTLWDSDVNLYLPNACAVSGEARKAWSPVTPWKRITAFEKVTRGNFGIVGKVTSVSSRASFDSFTTGCTAAGPSRPI